MSWTLVEPCCGTAALTMHLLGARRQLVPRQGSKWALRRELAARMPAGAPSRVVLSDASPWALVVQCVLEQRDELLTELRQLVARGGDDPQRLQAELHGGPVGAGPRMAAELLWLQRMAFAGKAVRVVGGRWSSPGLNLTSALGVEGTDRFGPVRPLGPALLRAVAGAPSATVEAFVGLARPTGPAHNTVVYLDPPYAGTTGYGADLDRAGVVALAVEWSEAGADVLVSEAAAVSELVALGWSAEPVARGLGGDAYLLFRARHRSEWITWRGRAVPQLPLWSAA